MPTSQNEGNSSLFLLGGLFVAFFSLMLGIVVRGFTTDMLQDTWLIWALSGAMTGLILSMIWATFVLEDDPLGCLKIIGLATIIGAILIPILMAIGWIEWQIINFWWSKLS